MAKTIRTYSQWRQEKLTDPERAARYLTAAKRESRVAFQHAVKNVIQANQVTKMAKEVGMARESVYRSFSAEGNPAFYTIDAVLNKLGIEIDFNPIVKTAAPTRTLRTPVVRRRGADNKRTKPVKGAAQILASSMANAGAQQTVWSNARNISRLSWPASNAQRVAADSASLLNLISSVRIHELGQQSTGTASIENRV